MNQHSIDTEKKKNDDSVYKRLLKNLDDSVRQSDKILVVLNQYAAPEALTRIWCTYVGRSYERYVLNTPRLPQVYSRFGAVHCLGNPL